MKERARIALERFAHRVFPNNQTAAAVLRGGQVPHALPLSPQAQIAFTQQMPPPMVWGLGGDHMRKLLVRRY